MLATTATAKVPDVTAWLPSCPSQTLSQSPLAFRSRNVHARTTLHDDLDKDCKELERWQRQQWQYDFPRPDEADATTQHRHLAVLDTCMRIGCRQPLCPGGSRSDRRRGRYCLVLRS